MADRVRLDVDGRTLEAEAGQTVLAALWNAGIRGLRVAVSGGERGPLCAMGTCFECRVTIDGKAHQRSCRVAVRDGMVVATRG